MVNPERLSESERDQRVSQLIDHVRSAMNCAFQPMHNDARSYGFEDRHYNVYILVLHKTSHQRIIESIFAGIDESFQQLQEQLTMVIKYAL